MVVTLEGGNSLAADRRAMLRQLTHALSILQAVMAATVLMLSLAFVIAPLVLITEVPMVMGAALLTFTVYRFVPRRYGQLLDDHYWLLRKCEIEIDPWPPIIWTLKEPAVVQEQSLSDPNYSAYALEKALAKVEGRALRVEKFRGKWGQP